MSLSVSFFHLFDLILSFTIYFNVYSLLLSPNFTIGFFCKDCLLFNYDNCHITSTSSATNGVSDGGGGSEACMAPSLEISALNNLYHTLQQQTFYLIFYYNLMISAVNSYQFLYLIIMVL